VRAVRSRAEEIGRIELVRTKKWEAMPTVALARHAMATRFELVLYGEREAALRAAGEEALAEIDRLENQLSLYRPGSEIAQLNARAAREAVRVSPEVFALLQQAAALTAATQGAFDITIAPLVRCWGFMESQGRQPEPAELAAAREVVGMHHVHFDATERSIRFTRPGVMLDLGAIGKGYAIERGVEILRDAGVTSALFHGGTSSIYALGQPPDADAWRVSLPMSPDASPSDTNRNATAPTISLCNESLSVSAVWGRAFTQGGQRFGHVIDPRAGVPVVTQQLAAVVLPSATETDALSTALLTMGDTGMLTLAQARPMLRAWLLSESGAIRTIP
jgi:thiamine biosynthesis lipoprotein